MRKRWKENVEDSSSDGYLTIRQVMRLKGGDWMTAFGIFSIWVLIIIAFGIYWHALRISQKLTKCVIFLEKLAETMKK